MMTIIGATNAKIVHFSVDSQQLRQRHSKDRVIKIG